jgi:hypothetical protein
MMFGRVRFAALVAGGMLAGGSQAQVGLENVGLGPIPGLQVLPPASVGVATRGAGDVDGDGREDLLVALGRSAVCLIRGDAEDRDFGGALSIASPPRGRAVQLIWPSAIWGSEPVLSGVGDFNGDGYDDIVVGLGNALTGEEGHAYLVLGGPDLWERGSFLDLSTLPPGRVLHVRLHFSARGPDISYTMHLAGAGDFNGDGFDDLALKVGISENLSPYVRGSTATVIFGKPGPLPAEFTLMTTGLVSPETGPLRSALFIGFLHGGQATGVGDTNGDGLDDLLISASHLIYGRRDWQGRHER